MGGGAALQPTERLGGGGGPTARTMIASLISNRVWTRSGDIPLNLMHWGKLRHSRVTSCSCTGAGIIRLYTFGGVLTRNGCGSGCPKRHGVTFYLFGESVAAAGGP